MTQISRISQKKSILQGDLHLRNLPSLCYLRMSFGRWLARAVTHQGQTITPRPALQRPRADARLKTSLEIPMLAPSRLHTMALQTGCRPGSE